MHLTKAQEQLLYMEQIAGAGAANIGGRILFRQSCTAADMEEALNKVLSSNDAFSLRLKAVGGKHEWYSVPFCPVCFEVLRFDSLDELDRYGEAYTKQPFDLSGALYDFKIVSADGMTGVLCRVHHLIGDAWSSALLGKQLGALLAGEEIRCFSYREYIAKQNDYLGSERHQKDKEFFLHELEEVPERTHFTPRQASSFRCVRKTLPIEKELADDIRAYAAAHDAYPYAVLMTAAAVCLNRLNDNAERFFLGMTMLNRSGIRENNTIGLFIDTVPVLLRLDNRKTFLENMSSVIDSTFSAVRHARYTYRELQEDHIGAGRLFDVVFNYQSAKLEGGETASKWYSNSTQLEALTISINDLDDEGFFLVCYDYRSDLFSERQIELFHRCFVRILRCALQGDAVISAMVLPDSEDLVQYAQLNDTFSPQDSFSLGGSVCSCFEEQVRRTPDRICLTGEYGSITFWQFSQRAAALDRRIRTVTHEKKQPIAILCDRSPEMYLALYAAVRGGNAYLPIDPTLPPERIRFVLRDSGVRLALVQEKYAHLLTGLTVLSLDDVWALPDDRTEPLPCAATAEDIAYILYTSGSAGQPKGVLIRNGSVINRIMWMQKKYPLSSESVILAKTPYTFDVSVWEIFWWGMCGGRLAYMAPQEHFLPSAIVRDIHKYGVTHLHFVPSVFSLLLEYLEAEPALARQLQSVCHVFLSGEALSAALVRRFHRLCPQAQLHNLYGPTECTVDVSFYDCIGNELDPVPIGKPIDNTQLYIVDRYTNLLPVGVRGELCIAGKGVGAGYLNRPQLTAERFTDNPFGGGRLYHTGDLAYLREDGNIVFVGRNDFQLKLHGQRIEPGEIEAVLLQLPAVRQVCVLPQTSHGQTVLAAYYTGTPTDTQTLRTHCAEKLPLYMVPGFFIRLEELPLTPNGKADRKALEAIPLPAESTVENSEPVTEEERLVCNAFREILHLTSVGRFTDFLAAGGTSLDVIAFLSFDERFSPLTAADFLQDPTPAGIAAKLCRKKPLQTAHSLRLLRRGSGNDLLVLLPFAGGDAEAYAALITALTEIKQDLSIAYLPYPSDEAACRTAAAEIADCAAQKNVSFYAHCVGNAAALQIIGILEKDFSVPVKALFAGAFIPPQRAGNIWTFTPDFILRGILEKAGSRMEELPSQTARKFLQDFRRDAESAAALLHQRTEKCHAPVHVLLSSSDPFTPHTEKAAGRWALFTTGQVSITTLESPSHYFQSTLAPAVASWIIERSNPR